MLAPILPALSLAAARAAAPSLRSWLMLGPILPEPPPGAARASTPPLRRSLSSSVFYAHPSLTPQLHSARPRRSTGSAPPPLRGAYFASASSAPRTCTRRRAPQRSRSLLSGLVIAPSC